MAGAKFAPALASLRDLSKSRHQRSDAPAKFSKAQLDGDGA